MDGPHPHDIAAALDADGCAFVPRLLSTADHRLALDHVDGMANVGAGTRCLLAHDWCDALARRVRHRLVQLGVLEEDAVPVQCTLFEKSAATNWLVAVHQDLGVPVRGRVASPAWRQWRVKEGLLFAQPPVSVLERLLAVRVHLDPCAADDGPLRVMPGTHRLGVLAPEQATAHRRREVTCLAAPADAWLMRPLALHASSKSTGTSRRRVLHLLFGPASLPDGARWGVRAAPSPTHP